jgi:hypothetical protein
LKKLKYALFSIESYHVIYDRNDQRSSPDGRVEPQAYGGRKILALACNDEGYTNDLLTFCNGSV